MLCCVANKGNGIYCIGLFRELLPRLPSDGVFAIDSVMIRPHASFHEIPPAQWFWKDDANQWQPFNNFDSRVIEVQLCCSSLISHLLGMIRAGNALAIKTEDRGLPT